MVPHFAVVVLLAAGGCGDGSASMDPIRGEQQKQARINAYGKSGMTPTVKNGGSGPDLSGQAAARRKAQGGR